MEKLLAETNFWYVRHRGNLATFSETFSRVRIINGNNLNVH